MGNDEFLTPINYVPVDKTYFWDICVACMVIFMIGAAIIDAVYQ